jgi:hypothetical protein
MEAGALQALPGPCPGLPASFSDASTTLSLAQVTVALPAGSTASAGGLTEPDPETTLGGSQSGDAAAAGEAAAI